MIHILVTISGDALVLWQLLIQRVYSQYDPVDMIVVGPRRVRFDLRERTFLMARDEAFFNNLRDSDRLITEWHTTFDRSK